MQPAVPDKANSNFESLYMKNPSMASDGFGQPGVGPIVPIEEEDQEMGSQKSDVKPIQSHKSIEIMPVDDNSKLDDGAVSPNNSE